MILNTLGQLKTLLDIQLLRGFSNEANNSATLNLGKSDFAQLLQEVMQNEAVTSNSPATMQQNMLGSINQLVTSPSYADTKLTALNAYLPTVPTNETEKMNTSEQFDTIINEAAKKYNLPVKLIKSIIKHESNFNPSAVSHAGASGLMQLMPATARGLGVTNILDPLQNIMGGSKYLRNMLDKYDGNLKLAIAAYNAGPGNVDKYGGIPPFKETQNYVTKVTNTFYS